MLPSQTQRGFMLVAILLGVAGWGWAAGRLQPGDGWGGWVWAAPFGNGAWGGVWPLVVLVLVGLPAVSMAAVVAAAGNPLSAVVSLAVAGAFAFHGESFGEAIGRADEAGRATEVYWGWAGRLAGWFAWWVVVAALLEVVRPRLRSRLGQRLTSRHLADGTSLWGIDGKAAVAAGVTAVVGGVLAVVLVRSADTGQVRGGLVLGFAIASLVGFAVAPTKRPGLILLAPGLVALGGYTWATQRYFGLTGGGDAAAADAFLGAFYRGDLPGVMVVLPIHAATAGVLGCAIGVGIGQVLEKAKLGEG